MKIKAAVAHEIGRPLALETVELDGPKAGEVLVKMKAAGICRSDKWAISSPGKFGARLPAIVGHEGAGVIAEVGAGVTSVSPGDHVLLAWMQQCGSCPLCISGRTNACDAVMHILRGEMADGSTRFKLNGQNVHHYCGTSSFAEYTVVPESGVIRTEKDVSAESLCFIGCGVATGIGSVINTAQVRPFSSVAVWGLGPVGLNVVQGAKISGAWPIIGIDIQKEQEALARNLGMTHFLQMTSSAEEVVEQVKKISNGGVEHSFCCVGKDTVLQSSFQATHFKWGTTTVVGLCDYNSIPASPIDVTAGRKIIGSLFGDVQPKRQLPLLIEMYRNCQIKVDEMITHRLPFDQINEGFNLLEDPGSVRAVVTFE